MKKKILVIAPILPQESDIEPIKQSLAFLQDAYELDFIDPLSVSYDIQDQDYYQRWRDRIRKSAMNYDAFLGFSFGGVILQQCFSVLVSVKKPMILFSTPSFADEALRKKLGEVIQLSREQRLHEALAKLHRDVVYPNKPLEKKIKIKNPALTAKRLIFGLQRVLSTDCRTICKKTEVKHWHFIGEHSGLVNWENVIVPREGRLFVVPHSGMRVLQDNLVYCKKVLLEWLQGSSI